MDAFLVPSALSLCRSIREMHGGRGATILWGKTEGDPTLDFAGSTAAGLALRPRRLECRFLYDAQGSALFEQITAQPEYYLTRTETAILAANAHRIRRITGAATLVELGSGSAVKTDLLLRAWLDQAHAVRYVPVDVSETALRGACRAISTAHPAVRVIGLHADYRGAFPLFRELSPTVVLFLGSTIGNFEQPEMTCFLAAMAAAIAPGDFFLLGIDLVKESRLIDAAYADAAGVTAAFTRNLFARMNRELGSDIDLDAIEHEARYHPEREQVEIAARFTREQEVRVAPLGKSFTIAAGEMVHTEISRKFRLRKFIPYFEEFGFATEEVFTDERDWFALLLLRRVDGSAGKTVNN
jgi:L-histidine N-alpha-methyltransferase